MGCCVVLWALVGASGLCAAGLARAAARGGGSSTEGRQRAAVARAKQKARTERNLTPTPRLGRWVPFVCTPVNGNQFPLLSWVYSVIVLLVSRTHGVFRWIMSERIESSAR